MADRTLLDVIGVDFGFAVDPDSDGGQILNSLTLLAPLTPQNTGTAKAAALTMVPSPDGLRVQAAGASDAMVMTLPDGVTRDVAIVPPTGGDAALRVEITLVAPRLKLPLLRPAVLGADGMLTADAAGDVTAVFPKVRLVVTAQPANPDATVTLAPSRDADGALAVQFDPVHALFGAGWCCRFPRSRCSSRRRAFPPLAMYGGGSGLVFEAGNGGGLLGDLHVVASEGAAAAARPRFIKSLATHVRLVRNSVMLLKLAGKIELSAEITRQLGSDIGDGSTDLDYVLTLALETEWAASLKLRGSGGEGFLWRSQRGQPHVQSLARDTMGAYAVFAPLLAGSLPGAGSSGYVNLALGAGLAAGLAEPRCRRCNRSLCWRWTGPRRNCCRVCC